jgi:hypothetical protein
MDRSDKIVLASLFIIIVFGVSLLIIGSITTTSTSSGIVSYYSTSTGFPLYWTQHTLLYNNGGDISWFFNNGIQLPQIQSGEFCNVSIKFLSLQSINCTTATNLLNETKLIPNGK